MAVEGQPVLATHPRQVPVGPRRARVRREDEVAGRSGSRRNTSGGHHEVRTRPLRKASNALGPWTESSAVPPGASTRAISASQRSCSPRPRWLNTEIEYTRSKALGGERQRRLERAHRPRRSGPVLGRPPDRRASTSHPDTRASRASAADVRQDPAGPAAEVQDRGRPRQITARRGHRGGQLPAARTPPSRYSRAPGTPARARSRRGGTASVSPPSGAGRPVTPPASRRSGPRAGTSSISSRRRRTAQAAAGATRRAAIRDRRWASRRRMVRPRRGGSRR